MHKNEHYPGKGCECFANCQADCGCEGIDWRSKREVELEEKLARLSAPARTEWVVEFRGTADRPWRELDYLKTGEIAQCELAILRNLKDGYDYRVIERQITETVKEW